MATQARGTQPQTMRQRLSAFFKTMSVEPVMLLDGMAFSNMVVLVETLQMDKVCLVHLNQTKEVCGNLSEHKDIKAAITTKVSEFAMYNGIILAIIPLFFILFMGAWSDKYGRKVPLCISTAGHVLYALGYLINSAVDSWPVEYLLFVSLLDSLGGGSVCFLTAANSYISDVTSEETRTSRLGLANSLWFLGGPVGTLMGKYIYEAGGYQVLFGTSLGMSLLALLYIIIFLPESHGVFANFSKLEKKLPPKQSLRLRESIAWVYGLDKGDRRKKDLMETKSVLQKAKHITVSQMFKDFINPQRFIESFKCTFQKREGHIRVFILLLFLCNILRRLGRGAYMYLFARQVLHWESADYSIWVTYKNFLAAIGSLVAVPVLSKVLKMSDNMLAMVGAFSSVFDYVLYGLVSEDTYFFMWLAPASALLVNSCAIAIRAILSKYVPLDELGKVSAMLGAVDGLVPMVSFALYTLVYKASVSFYPGAQFFFGASANFLMVLIFVIVMATDKTVDYNVETAVPPTPEGPVKEKSLLMRKDSKWLYDEENKGKIRLATILLSEVNYSIEVPNIESTFGKPLETIHEEPENEAAEEETHKREAPQKDVYENPAFVSEVQEK